MHVVSPTSCPREVLLYPMALMISSLWCCGLLCFDGRLVGIIVGCCVVILSFCDPSWVASRACRVWSDCGLSISICV